MLQLTERQQAKQDSARQAPQLGASPVEVSSLPGEQVVRPPCLAAIAPLSLSLAIAVDRFQDRQTLERRLAQVSGLTLTCHWLPIPTTDYLPDVGCDVGGLPELELEQSPDLWLVLTAGWNQGVGPLGRLLAQHQPQRLVVVSRVAAVLAQARQWGVADAVDGRWLAGLAGVALLERTLRLARLMQPSAAGPPSLVHPGAGQPDPSPAALTASPPAPGSEQPDPSPAAALTAGQPTEPDPGSDPVPRSDARLATILNSVIDGVAIVDCEGRIRYANPAVARLFRRSLESLMGQNLGLPIEGEATSELEILRADGSLGTGEMRSAAVDWLGKPAWAITICDISDRKQAEADLRYRLGVETAVAASARQLAAGNTVNFAEILAQVGNAAGVNRVLLLHVREDRSAANVISEWCDGRSLPLAAQLNPIELNPRSPWISQTLNQAGGVTTLTLADLPPSATHWRGVMARYSIGSALVAAIGQEPGELWGALVLCSQAPRSWLEADTQLLRALGDTIYAYCDRQVTQERLRASESLYASIFGHSDERIFLLRSQPDGRFVYETVNPAFERAIGVRAQDIANQSPYDLFVPGDAEAIVARLRACVAGNDTVRYEEVLTLNGEKRFWRTCLVPIRDSWNRTFKLLGSARDVTSERESAELQARQSRYRHLLASISLEIRQSLEVRDILARTVEKLQTTLQVDRVLFVRLGADGSAAVLCEALAQGIPGLQESNQLDWAINPAHPRRDLADLINGVRVIHDVHNSALSPLRQSHCQRAGIAAQVIVPVSIAADHTLSSDFGYSPQPGGSALLGMLCLQQCRQPRLWNHLELDLLHQLAGQLSLALYQAQLLEERTRNARELARSNESLEEFAYVASHDLQEPLRGTIAFAELLASEYADQLDETAVEYLRIVVDSSTRMRQLIRDLLAFSRVRTRGQQFTPTPAAEAVQRAIENLRAAITESEAEICIGELPTVLADPLQLGQLFQNLIGNALKFRSLVPLKVEILAERGDRTWIFSVRDNGIGLEPRYAERIFQIFQRLHNREDYEGTGIGLAICRKIVERHGGQIWVESEPGQGAAFFFQLSDSPPEQ